LLLGSLKTSPLHGRADHGVAAAVCSASSSSSTEARLSPCGPQGAARRLQRPQKPPAQTRADRGKNTYRTVHPMRRLTAALPSRLRHETSAGRTPDPRLAETTPSPLPAGHRWRQALGCLVCTREHVERSRPTRTPRGRAPRRGQHAVNRRIARRGVRIAHVKRRIRRYRIVHATGRRRQAGGRARRMEVCRALHTCRVRLTPGQPRGASASLSPYGRSTGPQR